MNPYISAPKNLLYFSLLIYAITFDFCIGQISKNVSYAFL